MNDSACTTARQTHRTKASTVQALTLSVNDELFIRAYLQNGRNAVTAYQTVHPTCKYTTAASSASRLLKTAKIQEGIARKLEEITPWKLEDLQRELLWCVREAKAAGDRRELREALMDYGKLSGLLIEKKEVKTINDQEVDQLRSIVKDALTGQHAN